MFSKTFVMRGAVRVVAVVLLAIPALANAWGPDGHKTVATIADRLIAGTPASIQVQQILGTLTMEDAAVWADCAKGIDPTKNYTYTKPGTFPECAVFETAGLEAEMSDYVRANDTNCTRKATDESCHKEYHYADIAIQHDHYDTAYQGARDSDVVAAIVAAVHRLKDEPVPPPFAFDAGFKGKRQALFLLIHLVGDVHQPLHVAAIYLDSSGARVNPDVGTYDPADDTRGGNSLLTGTTAKSKNLHSTWDAVQPELKATEITRKWLHEARIVPATAGTVYDWPKAWATETVLNGQDAFLGLEFGAENSAFKWHLTLPADYEAGMQAIKQEQITRAGGRLAQILQAIWP